MRKLGLIVVAVALSMLAACADHEGARRVLEDGYSFTDIHTFVPETWFTGCGQHDFYATGFYATNAHGKFVSGVVCAGGRGGKAATVRFN